jgi:NADPH2:quinone reductase
MRAVRFHETGGPEVLAVETVDRPTPRYDEILVEVRAAGVNPTEVYSVQGQREHPLPRIPGADFAGEVAAVGDGIDSVEPGDRVFGTGLQNDRQGTYAEYTVARRDRFAVLPESVSFEEGAAAGVVGATAWLAFEEFSRLTPTSTCLVHGGSGGAGHAAVQLAAAAGATVIATAGSPESRAFAAECGAVVVFDPMLGTYLQFDFDVLAYGGTVVAIGGPGDECRITDLWSALRTDATLQVFAMSNAPDLGAVLAEVAELLADGRLSVHLARTYSLEEAGEAQRAVMEDSFPGKLVLLP